MYKFLFLFVNIIKIVLFVHTSELIREKLQYYMLKR